MLLLSRKYLRVLSFGGDSTGVIEPKDSNKEFASLSPVDNGNFITSEYEIQNNKWLYSVSKLDAGGNQQWSVPTDFHFTTFIQAGDNFIGVGTYKPPLPEAGQMIITRIRKGGEVLATKRFGMPIRLESVVNRIVEGPGDHFTAVVQLYDDNNPGAIVRFNADGDTLWTKTYPYEIADILRIGPNRLLLACRRGISTRKYKPFFTLIDNHGNVIDSTVIDSEDFIWRMTPTNDGAWVATGMTGFHHSDAVLYLLTC